MTTFNEFKNKKVSEKLVLVHLEPNERLLVWALNSGSVYQKTVNHYIINIKEGGIDLTERTTLGGIVGSGEWFFDSTNKILYVRGLTDVDPSNVFTTSTYRLFFSNRSVNLPFDLNTGKTVPYKDILKKTSKFGSKVDPDDFTGIALSGTGSLRFENNEGFFNTIFDKLFWEGADASVYSYSDTLLPSNAQILYRGEITTKSFSPKQVSFNIRDVVERLRSEIPLNAYTISDGVFNEDILSTFKRRIYGRVAGLLVQSLDQTLDGVNLTGTFSGTAASSTITGVGSSLLAELSPEDTVFFIDVLTGDEVEFKVDSIASDVSFTVTETITDTFTALVLTQRPDRALRRGNRTHLVSDHEIREPQSTISSIDVNFPLNRFTLADASEFSPGDDIFVVSDKAVINRISGNEVVLVQDLPSAPSISDKVFRAAIQKVFVGSKELILTRDFTITNTSGVCKLVLDAQAELNIRRPSNLNGTSLTFTNVGRAVTGTATTFLVDIKPGDWLLPIGRTVYHEVLQINSDTSLDLRVPYSEATITAATLIKRPNYVEDDTPITVDCFGKTKDGLSTGADITTGAEVVEDLLKEAGLASRLETGSFTEAEIDAPYLISLKLPLDKDDERPIVRDIINLVNKSVFGNLHTNTSLKIEYNVLSPKKKSSASTIVTDDNILSWSVEASGKNIVKTVNSKYRHFDSGRFTGDQGSLTFSNTNSFINNISNISREETIDLYLYEIDEVTIVTQRVSLLREAANSVIKIKAKLGFIDASIDDVIYFEFDRLFERFGTSNDLSKIGVVVSVKKDGLSVDFSLTDLSSMFNKVCSIASNSSVIYANSNANGRAVKGYLTDSNGIVNSLNETYKMNVIG